MFSTKDWGLRSLLWKRVQINWLDNLVWRTFNLESILDTFSRFINWMKKKTIATYMIDCTLERLMPPFLLICCSWCMTESSQGNSRKLSKIIAGVWAFWFVSKFTSGFSSSIVQGEGPVAHRSPANSSLTLRVWDLSQRLTGNYWSKSSEVSFRCDNISVWAT